MSFSSAAIRIEIWIGLMFCLLGSGCRLGDNAWQTSVSEPLQYSSYWHDKWARARFRRIANDALEQEKAQERAERDDYHNEPFTPAHELGFVDGFVEFLDAGGTGEPPPLPPRKFWNAEFENPHGYQATIDWFHGYKHGGMSARASGIRHYVTIPVSDTVVSTTTPYAYGNSLKVKPINNERDDDNRLAGQTRLVSLSTLAPQLMRLPPVTEQQ